MRVLRAVAFALVLNLAAIGCAQNQVAQPRYVSPAYREIEVIVENQNWKDMIVFYTTPSRGNWQRLGRVGTFETRTFDLPRNVVTDGQVQFQVGSRLWRNGWIFEPVTLGPSVEEIRIVIRNALPMSFQEEW